MFNRFLDSACGYARNDGCAACGYAQNDGCMQLLILLDVLKFFGWLSWAGVESDKRTPAPSTHSTGAQGRLRSGQVSQG